MSDASGSAAPAVSARRLRRSFGDVVAVDDLTLDVQAGELFVLLGPSGSGKTTSLRLIAGFERSQGGSLHLHGEPVVDGDSSVPPERRGVGMVFQDYALFPHMTVAQNVAYGVRKRDERARRVDDALALTGLAGMRERSVHDLSGGEQQRVALARALAPRPRLLLLDEPFSNLDPRLRAHMRGELREMLGRAGTTALLVTHDQEEALSIADRIGFLWRGRIEQCGRPDELYREPATLHAARFIGDANVLSFDSVDGRVRTPFGEFDAPAGASRCAVVIRPEDLQALPEGVPAEVLGHHEYYGHDHVITVRLDGGPELRARFPAHEHAPATGDVALGLRREPLVFADDGEGEQVGAAAD